MNAATPAIAGEKKAAVWRKNNKKIIMKINIIGGKKGSYWKYRSFVTGKSDLKSITQHNRKNWKIYHPIPFSETVYSEHISMKTWCSNIMGMHLVISPFKASNIIFFFLYSVFS